MGARVNNESDKYQGKRPAAKKCTYMYYRTLALHHDVLYNCVSGAIDQKKAQFGAL